MTNADYQNAMMVLRSIDSALKRPSLTKREHFAAMILAGIAANSNSHVVMCSEISNSAREAVEAADALIAALNEEPKP